MYALRGDCSMALSGQDVGAPYPQCEQGRLHNRAEFHTNRPKDPMQVVVGVSYASWESVGDLECSECGALYGAKQRGANIRTLLDTQVRGFKNPPARPMDCPNCHCGITSTHTGSPSDERDMSAAQRREERKHRKIFLHCRGCNLVVWVEPAKYETSGFPPSSTPPTAARPRRDRKH